MQICSLKTTGIMAISRMPKGRPRRMFKKASQRGRSERGGEAYSFSYVEPLSDARTKLEDFFNIVLN
jgi:hypothetical protein